MTVKVPSIKKPVKIVQKSPQTSVARSKPQSTVWQWKNAEDYKNKVLAAFQKKLMDRGVKDTKIFVAQAISENGKLDPSILGDWECHNKKRGTLKGAHCSFGIPQINTWSSLGISAEEALRLHPEWKTLDWQLNTMADSVASHLKTYGSQKMAVVAHNCPSCAKAKVDACYVKGKRLSKCYYEKVSGNLALLK